MKKIIPIVILVISLSFPLAFGHPYTEETIPPQASNAPSGVTEVIIFFSEAIEIDFSTIKVLDGSGNQVDNKDTKYFEGEESLVVTTPPLEDGVYTVTSKVLSKIDGHLVPYAFVFAVGDVVIDIEPPSSGEIIFFPEAGARFPGLVGQTIILGSVISCILIWNTQRKDFISDSKEKIQKTFHGKFFSLVGIGLVAVFASNFIMLAIQTWRLETSIVNVLMTNFGTTWIIRMSFTIILLAIWFIMERKQIISIKNQIPLLIFSLALIATSTMLSHGAASEIGVVIGLDYIHNFISAIWIGGIMFFGFAVLPSLGFLGNEKKEHMTLLLIPRFSIMFVIALGILIISGPILLWFLESNAGLILESTYGKLILAKIGIALAMVSFGGYYQLKLQKTGEKNIKTKSVLVYTKLKRSLKISSTLGIILLGVVALLTNGALPAGEIPQVQAQQVSYGFQTVEFSDNAKFDISISPFTSGQNILSVAISDFNGNQLNDVSEVKVKISNPGRNVTPIEIPTDEIVDEVSLVKTYQSDVTFGFSGIWIIEIEALRTENANEGISISALIKPRLSNLKIEISEFEFPGDPKPLFPIYDGKGNLWISDTSESRIWKFVIEDEEFFSFDRDGIITLTLTIDKEGKIWFTDTPNNQIGFFDPDTEQFENIDLPWDSIPVSIIADSKNDMWVAINDKNLLLRYDQELKQFSEYPIPTPDGGPFALLQDANGNIWFSESMSGKIGVINPESGEIKEFSPEVPILTPEALYFDVDGNLWITAHTGLELIKFNPILETFERISVPDPQAQPWDMTEDQFGNIWFAQHAIDKLAVYDPHNNNLIEVSIPTETSWVQFLASDENNNIWFVEQRGEKLGKLKITEIPSVGLSQIQSENTDIKYVEVVAPLISLGIIATSLFFVKSVRDKRRINSLIE